MSRFVLSFKLSTPLEVDFCIQALQEALKVGTPRVFNSDQGSWVHRPSLSETLRGEGYPD